MKKLTRKQRNQIEAAYQEAMRVDDYRINNGAHAILVMILSKYGLPCGDVMEAYKTCERVLYGW